MTHPSRGLRDLLLYRGVSHGIKYVYVFHYRQAGVEPCKLVVKRVAQDKYISRHSSYAFSKADIILTLQTYKD